jgi:hypothetical protein
LGKEIQPLLLFIKGNLFGISGVFVFTKTTIAALLFIGLVILISFVYLLFNMNTKKIKARKTFYLLIWVFLISVAIYVFLPSVSVDIAWLLMIPVSYFLTHYFMFVRKKLVPSILFSILFAVIFLLQILNLF